MEHVNQFDRKYTTNPVSCPNEGTPAKLAQSGTVSTVHGKLAVHASGAFLVCGMCGVTQPIGRI